MQADDTLINENDIPSLEANIKLLAESPSVKLDEIDKYPNLAKAYGVVKSIAWILYDNGEYNRLLAVLKNNQPKNLTPVPGTLGAFLFGCLNTKGELVECSPECLTSLPNQKTCDYQVWAVSNGQLEQLSSGPQNGTSTQPAVVYANSLTPTQVSQLKQANVSSYTLVTKKSGKYRTSQASQNISSPNSPDPVNMNVAYPSNVANPNVPVAPNEVVVVPKKNNNTMWIIAIIVIIIIILLIWWWYHRKQEGKPLM